MLDFITIVIFTFFVTHIFVKYVKILLYKFLPPNENLYFLLSCYHCSGFWISLLSALILYGIGYRFSESEWVILLSWLSVVYALRTSPLFKYSSLLDKSILVFIFITITLSDLVIVYNLFTVPFALSFIFVLIKENLDYER